MAFIKAVGIFLGIARLVQAQQAYPAGEPNDELPLLLDADLESLRAGLDGNQFTIVDLVNAYIARIAETNTMLKAVTEINPDALRIAAELDAKREKSGRRPLYGVPVLVKDNMATRDLMNTTAGSYALLGAKVAQDSTVVAKLRAAGAIVLGKTSLTEWSGSRSLATSAGWSPRGGQVMGAYFPGQDPWGSSSGSAVATSIGLAWASLGTDTVGSIIGPAHYNNLVGIRPTVGLTSRYLTIPVSRQLDSVGPMARTVKDAAALLGVIAGKEEEDSATHEIPFDRIPDYVAACKLSGLRGKRIGLVRNIRPFAHDKTTRPVIRAYYKAARELREAGARIVDIYPGATSIEEEITQLRLDMYNLTLAGLASDLPKQYLSQLTRNPHNIKSVADLVAFTKGSSLEGYPLWDTNVWEEALSMDLDITSRRYQDALGRIINSTNSGHMRSLLRDMTVDAMVLPPLIASWLSAASNTPVVTVPLGRTADRTPVATAPTSDLLVDGPNRPFGISFIGRKWSEEQLIGMAYAFEQRTQVRRSVKPFVVPKTELEHVLRQRRSGRHRSMAHLTYGINLSST